MPHSAISHFMPSSHLMPPFATGVMPAAFIFSAMALNSAQVAGSASMPILSAAFFDTNRVLMR